MFTCLDYKLETSLFFDNERYNLQWKIFYTGLFIVLKAKLPAVIYLAVVIAGQTESLVSHLHASC